MWVSSLLVLTICHYSASNQRLSRLSARRNLRQAVFAAGVSSHDVRPVVSETQLASVVAGLFSRLLLHPIDSVKTRLQRLPGRQGTINAGQEVSTFVRNEGVNGLYRGILGALLGVLPYSLLYMPSYEYAQTRLNEVMDGRELLGLRHVLAGSIAGLCGSLVKVPMDVVKKRLQAGMYANVISAVGAIAAEGTPHAPFSRALRFYSGWRSSVIYDIPYNAIQFTVLENVKRSAKRITKRGKLRNHEHVFVGATTGMVTSIITEPLDVIKTRMMTQRLAPLHKGMHYESWANCFTTIVREEGPLALWKGTLPRLLWVSASSAVWYGTYAMCRQALAGARRKQNANAYRKDLKALEGRADT